MIWDESVLEKSESLQAERLCAVRSSKAARLKRIKPGYFNPPGGRPIFVPGFNWLQLLVTGMKGTPVLAHLCWWTTRGKKASTKREDRRQNPAKSSQIMGPEGYSPLGSWVCRQSLDNTGTRSSSAFYRTLEHNATIWWDPMDANRKAGRSLAANVPGTIAWSGMPADAVSGKQASLHFPFICPTMTALSFWSSLVQALDANPGISSPPNPFTPLEQAWKIVFAYARRWQIEMSLRFTKCEMAFESPRLLAWQARLKFLLIASLAYAFLLSLLPNTDFLFQLDLHLLPQNRKVEPR